MAVSSSRPSQAQTAYVARNVFLYNFWLLTHTTLALMHAELTIVNKPQASSWAWWVAPASPDHPNSFMKSSHFFSALTQVGPKLLYAEQISTTASSCQATVEKGKKHHDPHSRTNPLTKVTHYNNGHAYLNLLSCTSSHTQGPFVKASPNPTLPPSPWPRSTKHPQPEHL